MSKYSYDFFVVGAGSGGVRAARVAASHGARVGVAEVAQLGGTCVNVGCVPKKLLVYASEFAHAFADARGFGWDVADGVHDFARLVEAKNREIQRLNDVYGRLLDAAGVTLLRGYASFVDPHTLQVGETVVTAENILLAPGSRPFVPSFPGHQWVITSNEVFFLPALPRRILIVGAGYIAVEFACVFKGLGADVQLVHRGDRVLRGFDHDVRDALSGEMAKAGIALHYGVELVSVERHRDVQRVALSDGRVLTVDVVVMATGRVPNVDGLGLDKAGVVTTERGAIHVDAYSKTSVAHIYAVGDVTDRVQLTPVAIAEGHAVADTLFGSNPRPSDHIGVPSAVFSQPQVAVVGLSEERARAEYPDVKIFRSQFKPMKHTLSGRDQRTLMKLVVDGQTDRVLGCHMVGPDAAEIIQGFAVALRCGATKAQFDATVGIHPTAAEEFVTMRTPVT